MLDLQKEIQKAKNGDGISAYIVGRSYANGENGAAEDATEAFRWYSDGSHMVENALCLYGLGACYESGSGTVKDAERGLEYYRQAIPGLERLANGGNMYAQNCLGNYYYSGDMGISQSEKKAVEWFTKAANQGFAPAQHRLGWCYARYNAIRSDEKAVVWLTKAANQGYADAQSYLGVHYEEGWGVPQSYKEAAKWYEKAANQGHAPAQSNLGELYENGHGVQQSYEKAVELYTKAANQDEELAQNNLGRCYYNGYGVSQSYEKAVEWYTKAANQGDSHAQWGMGLCYESGHGVPHSYEKALEWHIKSANQSFKEAQNILRAFFRYDGRGALRRTIEIQINNRNGIIQGCDKASGRIYSIDELERLATNGDREAQCAMGDYYNAPEKFDLEKSAYWYRKAAEQGHPVAQNGLGYCLNDLVEAEKWHKKAADQGYMEGIFALGCLYNDSHIHKYEKAISLFEKVEDRGYPLAEQYKALAKMSLEMEQE